MIKVGDTYTLDYELSYNYDVEFIITTEIDVEFTITTEIDGVSKSITLVCVITSV
jgi:hypothetical protein